MQSIAQKSGHLNFGNLVAMMPQTKAADSELQSYQKNLVQEVEAMATRFQVDYSSYVKEVQNGNLSPKKQSERQEALKKKQEEITAYEQQMEQQLQEKRQELLRPILERAELAIKEVAQENGYEAVFDTSMFNKVLFAADSDDLMQKVKGKLGI